MKFLYLLCVYVIPEMFASQPVPNPLAVAEEGKCVVKGKKESKLKQMGAAPDDKETECGENKDVRIGSPVQGDGNADAGKNRAEE